MSEERALALGLKPKAYIRTWAYTGVDPFDGTQLLSVLSCVQWVSDCSRWGFCSV
jgi:acetyl-CoA acetyltransferase